MKWTLILIVFTGPSDGGVSVAQITGFESEVACFNAAKKIGNLPGPWQDRISRTVCVSLSESKGGKS